MQLLEERGNGSRNGIALISIAAHCAAIVFFSLPHTRVAPPVLHLATAGSGNRPSILIGYMPGGTPSSATKSSPLKTKKPAPKRIVEDSHPEQPQIAEAKTETLNAGSGNSTGSDSMGSGNISLALAVYFPTPHPDLSTMPRGTKGDVILEIVIDEKGEIANVQLASGLNPSINNTIIETVRRWKYSPASRDGQPIASEQELHFHYEA